MTPASPSPTPSPPGPPQDGSVAVHFTIPGVAVSVLLVATGFFLLYLVLTSRRVGIRFAWRRLGGSLLAGAVLAAVVVGYEWKTNVRLVQALSADPGGLHRQLGYAAASLSVIAAAVLFTLATMVAKARRPKVFGRAPRRVRGRVSAPPQARGPARMPGGAPAGPLVLPGGLPGLGIADDGGPDLGGFR